MEGERLRPVLRPLAVLFWVASGLVVTATVQLYVLTGQTDRFFAWKIAEPLTAAVDGAFYLAALILLVACARARTWTEVRPVAWGVLTISTIKLAATVLHRSLFHFDHGVLTARIAAWGWLVVYALVPVALVFLIGAELRTRGGELPRSSRLPQSVRLFAIVLAAFLMVVALLLLFAPGATARHWPWPLTDLTARDLSAWFAGIGLVGGLAALHDDPPSARHVWAGSTALALLQFVALGRYPHSFLWGSGLGWLYLVVLAATGLVGVSGWRASSRSANGARAATDALRAS